jgi:hypothetical protein
MEQKTKDCQSCKKQKLTSQEIAMIASGFLITGFAIYGIIHLLKHLF